MYGMLGALGAIAMTLEMDKKSYLVGEQPIYTLKAAIPGSRVLWASFKDGQPTGEYQADYSQVIDVNGTAQLTGGAWTDAQVGRWEKQALVIAPDGGQSLAQVFFNVAAKVVPPTPSATQPGATPASGGLLSGNTYILGYTIPLPPLVVYGGSGLLAYSLLSGGRRR